MRRTMTDRPGETPTRFVVERASRRVLGVHIPGAHILGDDAPEMMQAVAVAPVVGVTKGGRPHQRRLPRLGREVGDDAHANPGGGGGESGGVGTVPVAAWRATEGRLSRAVPGAYAPRRVHGPVSYTRVGGAAEDMTNP